MSEKTAISWTDSTVGFWSGCTKVSPGCAICWAEQRDRRHLHEPVSHWGPGAPRLKHKGAVKSLLAMNRRPWICDQTGEAFAESELMRYCQGANASTFHRRKVFLNQQADWLDPEVPVEWLADMLDTIRLCPELDIMLLTKRPKLWRRLITDVFHSKPITLVFRNWLADWINHNPPRNVMLGTTVEDQKRADERIPELLKIPAVFRFLSVEPQLEDIVFPSLAGINLLINGGESGPNARPFNLQWARNLRDQCKAAGTKFYMKQLGSNRHDDGKAVHSATPRERGAWRHPSGADPSEWPDDLRIQEPFSIQR